MALKLGANGLETDAWMTADGEVVLDHDGVHRAGVRKKSILSVTRDSLSPNIPSFLEFLMICPSGVHVSVDVKDISAASVMVSQAREFNFPLENLWLCHHNIDDVLQLRRSFSDVRVVDSTRLNKIKEGPEMRAALLAENGVDALNMHISDWSGGLASLVHRFEILAFGWDAQFAPAIETGLRMGLDGLYSDHVDRLVDAYQKELGTLPKLV